MGNNSLISWAIFIFGVLLLVPAHATIMPVHINNTNITPIPVPLPDLTVQDITRNSISYTIKYCNQGPGAGNGTLFSIKIGNGNTGQSFTSSPYSVPRPGACALSDSIACSLIGSNCTDSITVQAAVDSTNAIPEYNEFNNEMKKSFSVIAPPIISTNLTMQVHVVSPNGGEQLIQGYKNRIAWSGGQNRVWIGLVTEDFDPRTDRGLIGWIEPNAQPSGSLIWDGIGVWDAGKRTYYNNVSSGAYKILLVSYDSTGNSCLYSADEPCNSDLSDGTFTLAAPSIPPLPINQSNYTYTVHFAPGWNLFSVPLYTQLYTFVACQTDDCYHHVTVVSNSCSFNSTYHYDSTTKSYVSTAISSTVPSLGYWIRTDRACDIVFGGMNGASLEGMQLKTGWNQIGAPYSPPAALTSTSWNDLKGDCQVVSGPYAYNSTLGQYVSSSTLKSGSAYFVKVASDCTLGSSLPPLPN